MTYVRAFSTTINSGPQINVANTNALKSVRINSSIKPGMVARVGNISKFRWDPNATGFDSTSIIVPSDGSLGRWILETDPSLLISDLKTFSNPGTNQITITINGHTNLGDGGGGTFFWDPTSSDADNNGTIIQVTGINTGRWKRQYSGEIDARWFGIFPDNTSLATTNTSRLNALFATYAGTTGAAFVFPHGVYNFNGPLTIDRLNGARIRGDGDGTTIWQYNGTGTTPAHIDFVHFSRSNSCRLDDITFYGQPLSGTVGGVSGGISPVDYIFHLTSNGNTGTAARNTIINCRFQGGAIAGLFIGSTDGADINLDTNSFWRCQIVNNDGYGILLSDNNTNNTTFDDCSLGVNGDFGAVITKFPRGTIFRNTQASVNGILVNGHRYTYRLDNTFGSDFTVEHQVWELQQSGGVGDGMISVSAGSGGVFPDGNIILRDHIVTNNNPNGTVIIDAQGPCHYILDNVRIAGNGVDGYCNFNPPSAAPTYGDRWLETRGVTLYDGATLNVRTAGTNPMRWDGSGVVTKTNITDNFPTAPARIIVTNSDVSNTAAIAGSKINPNFGNQDLVAAHGTLSNAFLINGGINNIDQVWALIRGSTTSQTADILQIDTGGASKVKITAAGELGLNLTHAPLYFGGLPGSEDLYATGWLGIAPSSRSSSNFALASNGGDLIVNAPGGVSNQISISCGNNNLFNFKYSTSSAAFQTGVTNPIIKQDDKTTNGGTGNNLTIQAQNETGTTSVGGDLILVSGTGTSTHGSIKLQINATNRIQANGTGLGFFAASPIAKPTVTGTLTDLTSAGALKHLLTALANLGLITDSSS